MRSAVQDAGLEYAFQELIEPWLDPAYRLATSLLLDRDEAEDAVQEAAVKAWRGLARLRDRERARSWFFAIVVNECRLARRRPWWKVVRVPSPPEAASGGADEHVASLDLTAALRSLPAEDRTALFLYYWLDLPLEEVAVATHA